ncbi:glycosyltransferase family 4 protein [Gemmatimonadota bacterium]
MRILNSTTLHGWSAGSWYAIEMMRGLRSAGHEIHFLVPEGRTASAAREEGFTLHEGPDLRHVPIISFRGVLKRLKALRDEIEPDVVIAHNGSDHTWWGLLSAGVRMGKVPPLVRLRAHDPRPPASHPAARWLSRSRTTAFIVASESQRRAHAARLKPRPGSLFRIPPGFESALWQDGPDGTRIREACGADRDTIVVTSIARFAPQKDHDTFFAAADQVARQLPSERIHFLVAGYSAEYDADHIRGIAARYPALDGRWTLFEERLADGRELVRSADIGVVHSQASEAICRVAFEYMASGVPVVAARTGSLPEVIVDGRSGLLVDAGDVEAMAGAISRLILSSGLRSRLTREATNRILTVFEYARAVRQFESRLQIISDGPARNT